MLAPRSAIEGGGFVARPCSHVGIRCQHRQSEWAGIIEYHVPALDQFGTRVVAGEEKRCGESDAFVKKFNLFTTQIHIARSPHHFRGTLSRRTDC